MSRLLLNVFLLVIAGAFVAGISLLPREFTERNDEFIPGMVHSVPYDAQAVNPNFADGKTLQAPVAGSIARNFFPLHYQSNENEALRAGTELVNPFSRESVDVVERGAFVFTTFCSPCHGMSGTGDGKVAMRGFPPPTSLMSDRAVQMKDGQMFHAITYGRNAMPSFRSQLAQSDRWKVIAFIRTLQQKQLPVAQK